MENKFYTDDEFEHFLKDATDSFRMHPSKKVWYSIYNDRHPSRKWPSLAVCLLLITAILFVGVSNNNHINNSSKLTADKTLLTENPIASKSAVLADHSPVMLINDDSRAPEAATIVNKEANQNIPENDRRNRTITGNVQPDEVFAAEAVSSPLSEAITSGVATHVLDGLLAATESAAPIATTQTPLVTEKESLTPLSTYSTDDSENREISVGAITSSQPPVNLLKNAPASARTNSLNRNSVSLNNDISAEDKAWIENFAYNNKASISKFRSRSSVEYYVTPSVGFRFLEKNSKVEAPEQQNLVSTTEPAQLDINDEVTQKSAINLEAGVSILYTVSKKWRLKAGVQVNYTSYISFADALKHPSQAYLIMNRSNGAYNMMPRVSMYANSITGDKKDRLNNKTVQLSLPIGADYKLAGNKNLKWYAGATVQPGWVVNGQVFALSADTKNYIEEPSLLRKWNVSSAIETFISFKTPSGIIINAGPQLRYQLFSTYKKEYSYTEKLYNVGIKLGITKNF